jgi:leucine-rich PPR motif-containing protein
MLRATPLRLDGAAFAAGVGAYVSEGRVEEAERVLREMTAEGVRAGPRLFNTLITGYGREKNLRGVEASSMAMRTLGVTPNQATWGAKVNAYVSCDRLDLAMDTLEQGVRFSPRVERRPGVQAYTALVQGLAHSGRVVEADELLRRMARDGVKPNVYTYSTLIDGLAKSAQIGLAETALAEMRRAKIKPSVVTYNSLLKGVVRGIGKADRTDEVLRRAREMFDRMRDDGVPPDLVTYNTLIDACINARAPAEAWNILREISESGLKPDVVTYTTLLKYFVQVGDDSATQWVIAELETDPQVVETSACTIA